MEIFVYNESVKKPLVYVAIIMFFNLLMLTACSSTDLLWEKQEQGNPRAAAYAGEAMHWTRPLPTRPYVRWEFYYKHCTVVDRGPYPSPSSWDCTEP